MNDPRELLSRLAAPFAAEDLEWRLQIAYEDRMQGIAVPYVTNRAIQNRLDDVMGPDRWHNEFKPWHSTGKRESQLCGISLYFEERGWITKWDGAEDSDIEPIKGGLSDSMKRAANQWGIGRVLYSMDTVWVNVEKKGKSFIIKPTERGKLDTRYLETLKSLGLTPAKACGIQSLLTPALRAEEQTPAPTSPRRSKSCPSHRRTRPLSRFLPASTPCWRPRLRGRPCSSFWKLRRANAATHTPWGITLSCKRARSYTMWKNAW